MTARPGSLLYHEIPATLRATLRGTLTEEQRRRLNENPRVMNNLERDVLGIIVRTVGLRLSDMTSEDKVLVAPIPCYPTEMVIDELREKYHKMGWDADYTLDKKSIVLTRVGARD